MRGIVLQTRSFIIELLCVCVDLCVYAWISHYVRTFCDF